MILIDNQKFACSACINGHRSSSCHHTDRPLFEIKKKGRPVTQCSRCRELRKTRSYHSKCLCNKPVTTSQNDNEIGTSTEVNPGSKRKKSSRTAPDTPSLPNGIRDLQDANKSSDSEESRKRFKTMLNPCKCGCDDAKRCRCNAGDLLGPIQDQAQGSSCCIDTSVQSERRVDPSRRLLPKPKKSDLTSPAGRPQAPVQTTAPVPSTGSCCAGKVPQPDPSLNRRDAPIVIKPLSLPPGSDGPSLLPSIATWSTPASIPTLHKHITTTTDSCGCGEGCACAGCVEHRGAVAAAAAIAAGHHSCPDRCGTCQDISSANMRISSLTGPSVSDDTSIESLLARAIAKLPPPPPGQLSVFQSESGGERVALVVLPRTDTVASPGPAPRSCCAPAVTQAGNMPIVSALIPELEHPSPNPIKQAARRQRQMRSSSPSDDDLTDADAEGESDPGETEIPILSSSNKSTKNWAYAQLDIDVELELGLAADAIGKCR